MLNALIIFIKNPELGKVKTRLAATIGNENALKVYKFLLHRTKVTALKLELKRLLFYSSFVDQEDDWSSDFFQKEIQHSAQDLGRKMIHAFEKAQRQGLQKVIIIGSDCYDLNAEILKKGFEILENKEAVIGKALDGGYYCIGLNFKLLGDKTSQTLESLFVNKAWSHERVANEAEESLKENEVSLGYLQTLSDIDNENDLNAELLALIK